MPKLLSKRSVLMTVISLENTLQQGEEWKKFLDEIERRYVKGEVAKLIVVTTGYLQRYYFPLNSNAALGKEQIEAKAACLDDQWLKKQGVDFKQLKVPIAVFNWKDLLEQPDQKEFSSYNTFLQTIKDDFVNDEQFRKLVNIHAEHYISRRQTTASNQNAFEKAVKNYILEECAALQKLFQQGADRLLYPNSKPPPVNYIWKKYFSEQRLVYTNYKLTKKNFFRNPDPVSLEIRNPNPVSSGISISNG